MKWANITSEKDDVRAELENCQRVFILWLIMLSGGVHGRILARFDTEEQAVYVTIQMWTTPEKKIEYVERVNGCCRDCVGRGIAKILLDNHREIAQKFAIVIPEYALDEEELKEHWAHYLERSIYKVVRAI